LTFFIIPIRPPTDQVHEFEVPADAPTDYIRTGIGGNFGFEETRRSLLVAIPPPLGMGVADIITIIGC